MKHAVWMLLALCWPALGFGSDVPLAALGDLRLDYTAVQPIAEVPGPTVRAQVTHRTGSQYSIQLPRDVRRAHYLVRNGAQVVAGQPFVVLEGPEIHHFLLEFSAMERRYRSAEARYQRSRASYEQQALAEDRWVAIVDNYLALQLEYEHMRHFMELVDPPQDDVESITLHAPIDGYIEFESRQTALVAGDEVAAFLAPGELRVQLLVPAQDADRLTGVQLAGCRLDVEELEGVARGFSLVAWSAPVTAACRAPLNGVLGATPLYRHAAHRVPRSAVFTWEEQAHVLLRGDGVLQLVPVALLQPVGEDYAVTSAVDLAGRDVLSSSVSAVQGVLMGLGGE
ncbi:MAG: hypothetical protein CME43_06205 [Haliea sp.]|uniref:hypothetical protein n=1 Tax=Haliea sp. TaxID=1932666 RepID=UPI000C55E074|nr:hypothetical protein [Haliea sp.]MBM69054.1 hypothetical protein [Haliea sp.]|tara:strand:- start:4735 stop:5754 length:1020 start_codon:yes stop_codon:yes gene_type:complete